MVRMSEASLALALRIAGAPDVPALLDMMTGFNRDEAIPWDRVSGEGPLRHLLGSPDLGLIGMVERGVELLGYGILTWGFDLEYAGRDAFLTEFYLCPEVRGQGLAATAMDLLLSEACRHGVAAVHLVVRHDNTPALRAYERAGFTASGRLLLTRKMKRR